MWFSLIFMVYGQVLAMRAPAQATIAACDCNNPSRTQVYESTSLCTAERGEEPTTPSSINILLVQEVLVHQAQGFRCTV